MNIHVVSLYENEIHVNIYIFVLVPSVVSSSTLPHIEECSLPCPMNEILESSGVIADDQNHQNDHSEAIDEDGTLGSCWLYEGDPPGSHLWLPKVSLIFYLTSCLIRCVLVWS